MDRKTGFDQLKGLVDESERNLKEVNRQAALLCAFIYQKLGHQTLWMSSFLFYEDEWAITDRSFLVYLTGGTWVRPMCDLEVISVPEMGILSVRHATIPHHGLYIYKLDKERKAA